MSYVIICRGLAGHSLMINREPPPTGQYLKTFDPEAHQGLGFAEWTKNLDEAMQFTDQEAALRCWATVPHRRPTRPNGQLNKPLTAFTVEILPTPERNP